MLYPLSYGRKPNSIVADFIRWSTGNVAAQNAPVVARHLQPNSVAQFRLHLLRVRQQHTRLTTLAPAGSAPPPDSSCARASSNDSSSRSSRVTDLRQVSARALQIAVLLLVARPDNRVDACLGRRSSPNSVSARSASVRQSLEVAEQQVALRSEARDRARFRAASSAAWYASMPLPRWIKICASCMLTFSSKISRSGRAGQTALLARAAPAPAGNRLDTSPEYSTPRKRALEP